MTSTGGSKFVMVRYDGLLIMGQYMFLPVRSAGILSKPRVVGMQPTPDGKGKPIFVPVMGLPEEIEIPAGVMAWDCNDENLAVLYQEAVTGLVLAKPNVVTLETVTGGRA